MDYKKLEELNNLRQSGALTDEEFEREKQKLFDETNQAFTPKGALPFGMSENTYLGLMNFMVYIGWFLPLILWSIGRRNSSLIDQQGKYILNWYITWFIIACLFGIIFGIYFSSSPFYGVASILAAIYWSVPFIAIVGILGIAFPIIGGIKGLNDRTWKYPLAIQFLK